MRAKFLTLAVAAAFLFAAGGASAEQPRHHAGHGKVHRKHVKHVRYFSPPYGAVAPSVLGVPAQSIPAPSAAAPPPPPPAQEARPALITPGAPVYSPGVLVPGPAGTLPQCAPLSRSQGMC